MSGALPGWTRLTLGDIGAAGHFGDGDWVESKDQDANGTVRLTQLADVGVGRFRDRSDRWMREDQAKRLGCTFLQPKDVLIARMPDPIGRACLVPENIGRAVTAVDVAILRLDTSQFDPRYVMWALNSPSVYGDIVKLQSGTTRKRVSRRNLEGVYLGVPPLTEQRRIVDILEDHLSRLDAAETYVTKSLRRLDRMLVSVVSTNETIRSALRAPLRQVLAEPLANGRSVPSREGGFPVLRLTALRSGGLDLAERKSGAWDANEAAPYLVRRGDFFVSRGNGSVKLVAKGALLRPEPDAVAFPDTMVRIRVDATVLDPEYLNLVWNSPIVRRQIEAGARTTAGIHKVNQRQLESVVLPLPELAEQHRVLAELEVINPVITTTRDAAAQQSARSAALRRALLSAAFSGRLTGRSSDMDVAERIGQEDAEGLSVLGASLVP